MTPQQLKDLFNKPYSRLLLLGIIAIFIGVGVLLGNRLNADKKTNHKVAIWKVQNAAMITQLTKDFTQAQTDAKENNLTATANDCTQIKKDAIADERSSTIPDGNIEPFWKAALEDDVAGATACSEGAREGSTSLMDTANTDFNRGTTDLQQVSKDLAKAK